MLEDAVDLPSAMLNRPAGTAADPAGYRKPENAERAPSPASVADATWNLYLTPGVSDPTVALYLFAPAAVSRASAALMYLVAPPAGQSSTVRLKSST